MIKGPDDDSLLDTLDDAPQLRSKDDEDSPKDVSNYRAGFIVSKKHIPMTAPGSFGTDSIDKALTNVMDDLKTPLASRVSEGFQPLSGDFDHPPSYERATSETDVKRVLSPENSASSETIYKSYCRSSSSSPEDSDTDSEDRDHPVDKLQLVRQIELLKKEQEEMKRMQEAHDRRLKELLDREPCIHRRLESIRKSTPRDGRGGLPALGQSPFTPLTGTAGLKRGILHGFSEEHIYVQLEQLYANFHKLHFPTKTIQSVLGTPNKDSYYDVTTLSEISSLKEANMKLRKKVSELEAKVLAKEPRRGFGPQPHTWGNPGMKSAKSEGRLDEIGLTSPTPKRANFVAGRPTSPLPIPITPQEIKPVEITFRWTISDYSRKFRDERARGTKECSSPFYLSHCGYRAQMEAYLNGNGTATNRCMSVFLRIIKGDYDRYMKWPVNMHLVVILVNQSGNHSDSLRASGNQFQFQKPCGVSDSESDCWGLIEFVGHDMIQQRKYIKDDKIVLKCRVMILQ
ncbi:unnamed protein product [Lymnaea stagnalis]|uniref:MATH domain-containing protein n=1 Tax=Lymnaea stagnalis TaxID=6523 RepID=A0AAV2I082_LYMST